MGWWGLAGTLSAEAGWQGAMGADNILVWVFAGACTTCRVQMWQLLEKALVHAHRAEQQQYREEANC